MAAIKNRFYKTVTVVVDEQSTPQQSYGICLDQRRLKTPAGHRFSLPNAALAYAIAQEWDAQDKTIDASLMKLTGLAFTTIDNPLHLTREHVIDQIIEYLQSDTILYMADAPDALVTMQRDQWGELIRWANDTYGSRLRMIDGIIDESISEHDRQVWHRHLSDTYTGLAPLIGYQFAVEATKSVVVVAAAMARRLSIGDAVRLAMLEHDYQTKIWGNVEAVHEVERQELKHRLSAAVLFTQWTSGAGSLSR